MLTSGRLNSISFQIFHYMLLFRRISNNFAMNFAKKNFKPNRIVRSD